MNAMMTPTLAVGQPTTIGTVSFHPIYSPGTQADPAISLGGDIQVEEQSAANVPTLTVTNSGSNPVLLLEGEVVNGGLQDRILNTSVLVPAGATIDLPVSCVEHARWSGTGRFQRDGLRATRRVRRATQAGVDDNVRRYGERGSNQGAVWASVSHELNRLAIQHPTGSITAAQRVDRGPGMALAQRGPASGQVGVAISHGRRVVSVELFGSTELLGAAWPGIVHSALLDAPSHVRGTPSSTKVLQFLARWFATPTAPARGVGAGVEYRARTERLVAQSLTYNDVVVHGSAFVLAA